jgi:uncharacterized membrane protein YhaH (DUF805 family)
MDWNWYLFSFKGRINRAKFWLSLPILIGWTVLIIGIMWLIMAGGLMLTRGAHGHDVIKVSLNFGELFTMLGRASHSSPSSRDIVSLLGNLVGMAILTWICLATSVKRLHDRNKTGWWIVLFYVLPWFYDDLVDWLPTQYLPDWLAHSILAVLGAILIVLSIWGIVEMGFLRGTRGPNRFGPDPLADAISIRSVRSRRLSGWWIIVPFFVIPSLLFFPITTVLLGSVVLILYTWGWGPMAPITSRPRWDQTGEIEIAPHIGSPPPGMQVKRGHD